MTKKDLIINAYKKAQGKKSYKNITNELIADGVKVTYQYVSMILHEYNMNQKKSNIENQKKYENIKDNILIDIYEKINMICENINMICEKIKQNDPCDTRAYAGALDYNNKNISKDIINNLTSTDISSTSISSSIYTDITVDGPDTRTITENINPTHSQMEYEMPQTDGECTSVYGVDDMCEVDSPSYEDVPPTDGVRPQKSKCETKEKRNIEIVDATQVDKHNSKDEKKRYWDSWNEYKRRFPDLTDEEREHYFKMYTKKAEKIYAGDRLGEIRENIQRQYNYLSSRATANETPKQQQWKPEKSAVISISDEVDQDNWKVYAELYLQAMRNQLFQNPIVKAHSDKYSAYYTSNLKSYLNSHTEEDWTDYVSKLCDKYL